MSKITHSPKEKPIQGERVIIICDDGKQIIGYRDDQHITGFSGVKVPWYYSSLLYVIGWQYVDRND